MKKIYPDLWQAEEGNHFGMRLRTYLLATEKGNTLMYYTNSSAEIEDIKKLGGVNRQYISHHHEFTPAMFENLKVFKPVLGVHENAIPYLNNQGNNVITFNDYIVDESNIHIIHTPGHTTNNICMYYQSPFGKSYLFAGDTIYLDKGKFNYLIMPHEGGNKSDLKESLLKLRKLKVDVIMPSVGVGNHDAVVVTEEQWHGIIDDLLQRIGE